MEELFRPIGYCKFTSTGCPDRNAAASAAENFALIMDTRFARVSRLKITGGCLP